MSTENAWPAERTKTLSGGGAAVSSVARAQSAQEDFAASRHLYLMSMPRTAEYSKFGVESQRVAGGWVYGEHVDNATANADGSFQVAYYKVTEKELNSMRARVADVRENYDRDYSVWRTGAQMRRYL